VSIGNDRDGVHLKQKVGVGQARHENDRDRGRIGLIAPGPLEDLESGTKGLALDNEDVPLDHLVQIGPPAARAAWMFLSTCSACAWKSPFPTMAPEESTESCPPM